MIKQNKNWKYQQVFKNNLISKENKLKVSKNLYKLLSNLSL